MVHSTPFTVEQRTDVYFCPERANSIRTALHRVWHLMPPQAYHVRLTFPLPSPYRVTG